MKFLVTQTPKHKYNHLRSVVMVVEADSKAAALREAKRQCSDFEKCDTHTATTAKPFDFGHAYFI